MAQVIVDGHQENPFLTRANSYPTEVDEESQDDVEETEASDRSSDAPKRRRQISHNVKKDMFNLERIFMEKGMKYKLINRIGEGMGHQPQQCQPGLVVNILRDLLHCVSS